MYSSNAPSYKDRNPSPVSRNHCARDSCATRQTLNDKKNRHFTWIYIITVTNKDYFSSRPCWWHKVSPFWTLLVPFCFVPGSPVHLKKDPHECCPQESQRLQGLHPQPSQSPPLPLLYWNTEEMQSIGKYWILQIWISVQMKSSQHFVFKNLVQ